jgi:hypothetical protein
MSIITSFGYAFEKVIDKTGEIYAIKYDTPSGDNFDKLVVWLERDFVNPNVSINVFMIYGRYEIILGHGNKAQRIIISQGEEDSKIAEIRRAIIDYCMED